MDYTQVKGNDGLTDDERRRAKHGLDAERTAPATRKGGRAATKPAVEPNPEREAE
jgi:hypothetical protein